MPYITLDYRDGRYTVWTMTEDEADRGMQQGQDFAHVTDTVFAAWQAHQNQDEVYQALWRTLDNELKLKNLPRRPSDIELLERKVKHLETCIVGAEQKAEMYHNMWLTEKAAKAKK